MKPALEVEILIVIAIVGMLSAILIPALKHVKEESEILKEHPHYSQDQVTELMHIRENAQNDKAELAPLPDEPVSNQANQLTQISLDSINNGIVVDKMVINNLKGDKTFTVV